jgi:metallophosphoesterase superfamily enzyme
MITQQKIDEIVSRIVAANNPDKIILFGNSKCPVKAY